jgi:uncharacterized membrane protein HdeD (DUF308 family)
MKKQKFFSLLGVFLICVGLVVFSDGKPDTIDPSILNPTWESMLAGLLLCLIGWLIGHKHFKHFLDDADIK